MQACLRQVSFARSEAVVQTCGTAKQPLLLLGPRLASFIAWIWCRYADGTEGRRDGDCLIILDECHKAKRLINTGGSALLFVTSRAGSRAFCQACSCHKMRPGASADIQLRCKAYAS